MVFGGVGLALTISAACRDAPAASRLHSLHAHFLRPVHGGQEIVFHSEVVKAGRTFNLHLVTASQDGKPVITMTCSFTADTDGYVYDLSGIPDGVPLPDDLPEPDDAERRGRPVGRALARAQSRCDPTAPARRRTATGSACPGRSTTTRTCTPRCSATPPTGPASAGGPCTSTATPPA